MAAVSVELSPPNMDMRVDWTADQLIGYISTWSAVRAMEKAEGDGATRRRDSLRAVRPLVSSLFAGSGNGRLNYLCNYRVSVSR